MPGTSPGTTPQRGYSMSHTAVRGMIAVDKIGTKILFLDPKTYETETVLDGFQKTVHELLVIPETALWWLEHYAGFAAYLAQHYGVRGDAAATALVVALSEGVASQAPQAEVH